MEPFLPKFETRSDVALYVLESFRRDVLDEYDTGAIIEEVYLGRESMNWKKFWDIVEKHTK